MTVLAGHLPALDSTHQIALTTGVAHLFDVSVGGRVTYQFANGQTFNNAPTKELTYRVAAIVELPPALVDQFDQTASAVLPPAATAVAERLPGSVEFSWVGVRLVDGSAGIPAFQAAVDAPERPGRSGLHLRRPQARHGPPAGPRGHPSSGCRAGRPWHAGRARPPGARGAGPGPAGRSGVDAGRSVYAPWGSRTWRMPSRAVWVARWRSPAGWRSPSWVRWPCHRSLR